MKKGVIREAQTGDELAIIELIKALALYENAPEEVINTPEQLAKDLFQDRICDCLVYLVDEQICAIALYYTSYSTWKGRCLYLEDIYVHEEFRRLGIGEELFLKLIEIAKKRKVKRMDWQVLNWNEPAIKFYKKMNATLDPEWINGRLFF